MDNKKKMIEGVIITPLKQIEDENGKVMHMLRNDSKVFKQFGEIYFSVVNPKAIKAWRKHKEMFLNYACIEGNIKVVLYDDRKDSKTFGEIEEIELGNKNYNLITIPPMIWTGFKSEGNQKSIIANCSTIPHSQNEIIRKPATDKSIPYNWKI